MKKTIILGFVFFSTQVLSRPVTAPGALVGLPMGKPFPQGWYLTDSPGYIDIPVNNEPSTDVFFNAPRFTYVTPYIIAKGQLEIDGGTALAYYKSDDPRHWYGNLYNPDLMAGLAWDIGNNFYFSNFVGTYFPINVQGLATDQFVFNNRSAITYSDDRNDLTANVIYGVPGKNYSSVKPPLSQYFNLDLTMTRRFKELQIGPIAFGSWDYHTNNPWSQFAVGALVGYDFGQFAVQGWVANDTNSNHWGGRAISAFFRVTWSLGKRKPLDTSLDI